MGEDVLRDEAFPCTVDRRPWVRTALQGINLLINLTHMVSVYICAGGYDDDFTMWVRFVFLVLLFLTHLLSLLSHTFA